MARPEAAAIAMVPLLTPYCFRRENDAAIGWGRLGGGGRGGVRGRWWCAPTGAVGVLIKAGDKVSRRVKCVIVLGALTAKMLYGAWAHVEEFGGRPDIGFWTDAADTAMWQVQIARPAKFSVELTYACDPTSAGSKYDLQINGKSLKNSVTSTRSWTHFMNARLGDVTIVQPGKVTFVLKPSVIHGALLNLRSITLTPEK
ncbi:MAG: hypothetical protein HKL96_09230 [Phycisphaerales bacterium]|nr:hypothetical protein [Phycisphaerales bacterium]